MGNQKSTNNGCNNTHAREPREYDDVDLGQISQLLGNICKDSGEMEYHCEKMKQILWCASANQRYPDDPTLKNYCGNVDGIGGDTWSVNFSVKQILREMYSPHYVQDNAVVVEEMRNFTSSLSEIRQNGYSAFCKQKINIIEPSTVEEIVIVAEEIEEDIVEEVKEILKENV